MLVVSDWHTWMSSIADTHSARLVAHLDFATLRGTPTPSASTMLL